MSFEGRTVLRFVFLYWSIALYVTFVSHCKNPPGIQLFFSYFSIKLLACAKQESG